MKLNEFSQKLDSGNRAIDILERFGVSQLVRLSTYLGPAVPAYFVYEAAKVHLTHDWTQAAFVIAFVLELLGLGVIYNLNDLFEWNRKYAEQQVSTSSEKWLVFFYAAQIFVIVFGLKIYPDGFLWLAIFGLSSLSILTGFAYSQSQQHKARVVAKEKAEELSEQEDENKRKLDAELREQRLRMELDIAKMKAQNELEIERKKAEVELQAKLMKVESKLQQGVENSTRQSVEFSTPPSVDEENSTVKKSKIQHRRNMVFQHIKMNGDPGPSALSDILSVDRGTIYNDLKALVEDGSICKNGDGGYHIKN